MLFKPKRTLVSEDVGYGVCLWRLKDGSYVQDSQGNYLCAQAKLNDLGTERKIIAAARELGIEEGGPFWLPGFRTISNSEYEDQMADLLDGGVPDAVDLYKQKKFGA